MKSKLTILVLSLISYLISLYFLWDTPKVLIGIFLFVLANNLSVSAGRMK